MSPFSIRMIILQTLVVLGLSAFCTTFWYSLFGNVPAPQLWLCWVLYLALYRGFLEALFLSYGLGLTMTAMTSLQLKVIWFSFLTLVGLTSFARNKVFWPGLRYFTMATFLMCVAWNISLLGYSWILEPNSAELQPLGRIFEVALTTISSPLVYGIMTWLERFRPDDTGAGVVGAQV